MSPEERQLLNELFTRVGQAASTPRDAEAEALIRDELARHPYAAYYLAQAVILQEKGLEASAARIGQLEAQVKDLQQGATAQQGQGGFLSGLSSLFGGNAQGQGSQPPQPGPWGRSGPQAPAYDGVTRVRAHSPVRGRKLRNPPMLRGNSRHAVAVFSLAP